MDEATWNEVKAGLRKEYEWMLAWLRVAEEPADLDGAITVMAQVAHAAFHLGAMRLLLKIVRPQSA